MKRTLKSSFMFSLMFHLSVASADIVVRDQETSETEFQALALAQGHTPMADVFLNATNRISSALSELFRVRLIEAQAEWLDRTGDIRRTDAIDRFLALAHEADWGSSERRAFLIFYVRKFERSGGEGFDSMAPRAFALTETIDLTDLSAENRHRWDKSAPQDATSWRTFDATLPTDVTYVVLNGLPIARSQLPALKIPPTKLRMTMLSNAFRPATVIMSGQDASWPTITRVPWIGENCQIAKLVGIGNETKISILGLGRCQKSDDIFTAGSSAAGNATADTSPSVTGNSSAIASTPNGNGISDQEVIRKFGLERGGAEKLSLPMETPTSSPSALLKKPWFWGLLGAVAIGTVVALSRPQPTEVQPTNREGW